MQKSGLQHGQGGRAERLQGVWARRRRLPTSGLHDEAAARLRLRGNGRPAVRGRGHRRAGREGHRQSRRQGAVRDAEAQATGPDADPGPADRARRVPRTTTARAASSGVLRRWWWLSRPVARSSPARPLAVAVAVAPAPAPRPVAVAVAVAPPRLARTPYKVLYHSEVNAK